MDGKTDRLTAENRMPISHLAKAGATKSGVARENTFCSPDKAFCGILVSKGPNFYLYLLSGQQSLTLPEKKEANKTCRHTV